MGKLSKYFGDGVDFYINDVTISTKYVYAYGSNPYHVTYDEQTDELMFETKDGFKLYLSADDVEIVNVSETPQSKSYMTDVKLSLVNDELKVDLDFSYSA